MQVFAKDRDPYTRGNGQHDLYSDPFPSRDLSVPTPERIADALVAEIKAYGSCAVAFSAGVDSTVVAKAARLALGDRALAVTGVGPAVADGELAEARQLADLIGIRHVEVATDEINQPRYIANEADRCF
ncbi:MAG: hypothetical protein AAGF31_13865, partial [Planctomycetota bacterium]